MACRQRLSNVGYRWDWIGEEEKYRLALMRGLLLLLFSCQAGSIGIATSKESPGSSYGPVPMGEQQRRPLMIGVGKFTVKYVRIPVTDHCDCYIAERRVAAGQLPADGRCAIASSSRELAVNPLAPLVWRTCRSDVTGTQIVDKSDRGMCEPAGRQRNSLVLASPPGRVARRVICSAMSEVDAKMMTCVPTGRDRSAKVLTGIVALASARSVCRHGVQRAGMHETSTTVPLGAITPSLLTSTLTWPCCVMYATFCEYADLKGGDFHCKSPGLARPVGLNAS